MPPITKIWLCTLKDPNATSAPEFQQLIHELLGFCASYTNPSKDSALPPMHAFYQDTQDPAKLFMITGYPSQEMNTEADKLYAERYLPRMFGFVQHKALFQLDVDVQQLPLSGHVVVTAAKRPDEWKHESAFGAWDYWLTTKGITVEETDRVWLQIQDWDGSSAVAFGSQTVDGEVLLGKQIGSS